MAHKHQIFRWDIAELMKMRMLVRLKRIESTDWWFLIMFVSISQVVCRWERVGSIVVYSIQVVNSCYSLTLIINHQVKIQIKMKYFPLLLSIYTNRFLLLICSLLKSEKCYSIIILKYFYQCYFVLSLPVLDKNFIVITDIYVYQIDSTSLP